MSDKSSQNDPSMVEILGSIRRIINEDNAETDSPEAAPGGDEEILDLTEEVAAEDTGESRPDTTFGAAPVETEESEVRREPVLGLHRPGPADEGPAMEQPEAEAEAEAEPAAEEISEFGRRDQQDMTSAEDENVPMPDPPEPVQEPLTPPEEADGGRARARNSARASGIGGNRPDRHIGVGDNRDGNSTGRIDPRHG